MEDPAFCFSVVFVSRGSVFVFKGAQPPSLVFRGATKIVNTKPTSNINLAFNPFFAATAMTQGSLYV
jgi:hypothetical protein